MTEGFAANNNEAYQRKRIIIRISINIIYNYNWGGASVAQAV
jgi:hypothetical protein